MQIQDILNLSDDYLEKLSEEELKKLLAPLIPIVRTPNKAEQAKEINNMVEKLSKLLGV
jgi:hypothetical protein